MDFFFLTLKSEVHHRFRYMPIVLTAESFYRREIKINENNSELLHLSGHKSVTAALFALRKNFRHLNLEQTKHPIIKMSKWQRLFSPELVNLHHHINKAIKINYNRCSPCDHSCKRPISFPEAAFLLVSTKDARPLG